MSERRSATPFYLHERNEPVPFHHEVYLLTEKANVAVEDSPTLLTQEPFGQGFETASTAYVVQE